MRTLTEIQNVFNSKGYITELNNKPNIFGIRKDNTFSDKFDDAIGVFWGKYEIDNFHIWEATTEAGKIYAKNPLNGIRTAVMVPGQYINVYGLGLHKNYEALVQIKEIAFYQDVNKDLNIDTDMTIKLQMIGANIHGTRSDIKVWSVDKFSAACQVIWEWKNFVTLRNICKTSEFKEFNYTLLEEKDFCIS